MYTDDNLVYLERDQNYVKSLIHSKNLNFNTIVNFGHIMLLPNGSIKIILK